MASLKIPGLLTGTTDFTVLLVTKLVSRFAILGGTDLELRFGDRGLNLGYITPNYLSYNKKLLLSLWIFCRKYLEVKVKTTNFAVQVASDKSL